MLSFSLTSPRINQDNSRTHRRSIYKWTHNKVPRRAPLTPSDTLLTTAAGVTLQYCHLP